jgi:hypothetical protein
MKKGKLIVKKIRKVGKDSSRNYKGGRATAGSKDLRKFVGKKVLVEVYELKN